MNELGSAYAYMRIPTVFVRFCSVRTGLLRADESRTYAYRHTDWGTGEHIPSFLGFSW